MTERKPMTLEERSKEIAYGRFVVGPIGELVPATYEAHKELALGHLKAVELAAYERAKEEVHKELCPKMNHYWNSAIAVAVSNIRALASGGSDD